MTSPTAPTTAELDQAVIDAGKALIAAQTADPRDEAAINQARLALQDAMAARWPNG